MGRKSKKKINSFLPLLVLVQFCISIGTAVTFLPRSLKLLIQAFIDIAIIGIIFVLGVLGFVIKMLVVAYRNTYVRLASLGVLSAFIFFNFYVILQSTPNPISLKDFTKHPVVIFDRHDNLLYKSQTHEIKAELPTKEIEQGKVIPYLVDYLYEGHDGRLVAELKKLIIATRLRTNFEEHELSAIYYHLVSDYASARVYKRAPHVVDYVLKTLNQSYGKKRIKKEGAIVYTTIDLKFQNYVQQKLLEVSTSGQDKKGHAAVVIIDENTSEIIALIGSSNYYAEPKNYFTSLDKLTMISRASQADATPLLVKRDGVDPEGFANLNHNMLVLPLSDFTVGVLTSDNPNESEAASRLISEISSTILSDYSIYQLTSRKAGDTHGKIK